MELTKENIERLRQRIAELEELMYENPTRRDLFRVIAKQRFHIKKIETENESQCSRLREASNSLVKVRAQYKQRGERMKWLYAQLQYAGKTGYGSEWFDENGEPL